MALKEVIGIFGLLLIIAGNLTIYRSREIQKKYTYPLLILGGICMVAYSFYLRDKIFIVLQIFFVLAAIYGLIKIQGRGKRLK